MLDELALQQALKVLVQAAQLPFVNLARGQIVEVHVGAQLVVTLVANARRPTLEIN